jgi:hypothetical protein
MEDFNMKTNYKRALKAMAKMEKRIYFDTLDSVVLVSESHFIISVPYADWQELVKGASSVFEKNTMTQIDLKQYHERFVMENLPITKVGINFSSKTRNITDWKIMDI